MVRQKAVKPCRNGLTGCGKLLFFVGIIRKEVRITWGSRCSMARRKERSFGQVIGERRRQLDLTQQEVARRIRTSTVYISHLESGLAISNPANAIRRTRSWANSPKCWHLTRANFSSSAIPWRFNS
jgi:DNA-binding transcriptional regulator YiaG